VINIYGIRHHGPGSARNLLHALENNKPDLILLECPSDAQSMVKHLDFEEMIPPVALLVYEVSNLKNFAYYPFAVFSPEWQAMYFAHMNQIPVHFIDLPFSMISDFSLKRIVKTNNNNDDPFRLLAIQDGFQDIERWWEVTFEIPEPTQSPFDSIMDLIEEIRIDTLESDPLTLAREAYMKNQIEEFENKKYKSIAVVCGAWHAPALRKESDSIGYFTVQLPKKGLKVQTESTWVPWSYDNIARTSGYKAGVISPYWYEALFFHGNEAIHHWLSRVAGILRNLQIPVSPADIIESSRLAQTLADMRDLPLPGIDELYDAVIAVCVKGDDRILSQMTMAILIGDVTGFVPTTVPGIPLQRDIEKTLKSLRLFSLWQKPGIFERRLDRRKKTHQRASILFNRLRLIGINWALEQPLEGNPIGAFNELWILQWQPDFPLIIVDKSRWGNTLKEAVIHYLDDILPQVTLLPELSKLLLTGLKADLPETVVPVIKQIQDIGQVTKEIVPLLEIFPDLVQSQRYGSRMEFLRVQIGLLIGDLYPRICILLSNSIRDISDETAEPLKNCIIRTHHAIHLIEEQVNLSLWYKALLQAINTDRSHPLIVGVSLKLLFSKDQIDQAYVVRKLRYELSLLSEITSSGLILEGFLSENGWWLIHFPALRAVIDEWIGAWEDDQFLHYLPVLRRIFSSYSTTEKQVLLDLVRTDNTWERHEYPILEPHRKMFFNKAIERLNLPSDQG
jgi:hypothetical protein